MPLNSLSTLPIGLREPDVLGTRLKAIRCVIGKQRTAFAAMFGVTDTAIKRYENGQTYLPFKFVRALHLNPLTRDAAFILLLPVFNTSEWLMVNALTDVVNGKISANKFRTICEIEEP